MESRRRPRWPPPAHPKLLSVDGQSGPLDEQASGSRARCAKTQPMRFRLPQPAAPGFGSSTLAPASSAPVPTRRGTGHSAVRRTGLKPARQLPRTRQREPLCRDPSRLHAGSPRTPATPAFVPRVGRPDRFSEQRTVPRARPALWPLCWCISQAAVLYAAATRAVDAGQASGRDVGVAAHNDCQGSRQSAATVAWRHQGVTRRVFSMRLAAQGPDAASAACHYPLFANRPNCRRGSDRRLRLAAPRRSPPPTQPRSSFIRSLTPANDRNTWTGFGERDSRLSTSSGATPCTDPG